MQTLTYNELCERVATERGTVLGYTRSESGMISGPKRLDIHKTGGQLVEGFRMLPLPEAWDAPIKGGESFPAVIANAIPVVELTGWPHSAAAEIAPGMLLALKD